MAEIINLRLARKGRKRVNAEKSATENRARHGRTKADKQKEELEQSRAGRAMDGHQIEDDENQ